MSRLYRIDVDVSPCTADNDSFEFVQDVLREHAVGREGNIDLGPTTMGFFGHVTLAGGMMPREKHKELCAALPGKKVATRWLDLDAHPWDEEFGDDDADNDDAEDDEDGDGFQQEACVGEAGAKDGLIRGPALAPRIAHAEVADG